MPKNLIMTESCLQRSRITGFHRNGKSRSVNYYISKLPAHYDGHKPQGVTESDFSDRF